MHIIYRPVDHWPGELTVDRSPSPFTADWKDTLEKLEREVGNLTDTNTREYHAQAVVQLAVPEGAIRQDGQLAAGRREPEHPGVILNVETANGPLRFSCDRFTGSWRNRLGESWRHNLRAIALGLEALRRVERYGMGSGREQYAGFQALPPATAMGAGDDAPRTVEEAVTVLGLATGALGARDALRSGSLSPGDAWKMAAKVCHPDVGGDPALFRRVTAARDLLIAHPPLP